MRYWKELANHAANPAGLVSAGAVGSGRIGTTADPELPLPLIFGMTAGVLLAAAGNVTDLPTAGTHCS